MRRRLYVRLPETVIKKLADIALSHRRHPADEAALLIEQALKQVTEDEPEREALK